MSSCLATNHKNENILDSSDQILRRRHVEANTSSVMLFPSIWSVWCVHSGRSPVCTRARGGGDEIIPIVIWWNFTKGWTQSESCSTFVSGWSLKHSQWDFVSSPWFVVHRQISTHVCVVKDERWCLRNPKSFFWHIRFYVSCLFAAAHKKIVMPSKKAYFH